jgi:RNA polymerase sigma-70 factor (ECF subfamily)
MTFKRNIAIDKTRSRKVRTDDIDAYFNIKDKTPSVDLNLEQKERMNSILKLLNDLPEQQRQIIHLRDVEGYTYKEIAEITENSLDFVKVSLHRARKNLKEALLKRNFKRHDN